MSASVCCPRCQVTSVVPVELLGRTGRCNKCGRRIRLASPVAELLDESDAATVTAASAGTGELAPLDALPSDVEPIEDLPSLEPAHPTEEDDWPDAPVLLDGDDAAHAPVAKPVAKPKRERREPAPGRRGPSKALLVLLALVGLLGGGATGAGLLYYLTKPEPKGPEPEVVANDPPAPAPTPNPPAPAPAPPPPNPNPDPNPTPPNPNPDPKLNPEIKPPPPPPPPPPMVPEQKNMLKLPGAAATVTAGGGGRYVVFQMADTGQLATLDTKVGRIVWTLNGARPDDIIAASREKLFIGKVKDARVDRFDLFSAAAEGRADLQGAEASLKQLAVGSASDGPLLMITHSGTTFRIRLLDATTFAELSVPIDDPGLPGVARGFPIAGPTMPARVAVSANGRAMTLSSRYLLRRDDKYKGGLLSGAGVVFPAPDGQAFLGSAIYSTDGVRSPPRPGGLAHRYIPAAGGPFVVSVEYKSTDLGGMKLFLHYGNDPNPLGPLPGGEFVGAWAKTEPGWTTKLHQRLVFAPDPGLLIFAPPGADSAHVIPVDIAAMLKEAGRDPVFTSVAPAETRGGRVYNYRPSVAGAHGAVTFAVEAGPPGMAVGKDGLISWTVPNDAPPGNDVRISARDAEGRRAVQSYRLVVWKEPPAAVVKKPDPVIEEPKKFPEGNGRSLRLPAPATEAVPGGNGRFLLLNMPTVKQVAVFDAKEGKVIKSLAMDAEGVVIAAGREHLFVVNNEAKTLQRWSLATFEKEAPDKLPAGGPFSHAFVGANSVGPLLLCPKGGPLEPTKPFLLDVNTLREIPLAGDIPAGAGEMKALARSVRVSADGQTFTWAAGRTSRGAIVAKVAGDKAQWKAYPNAGNPLTPGADGQSFYAYDGVYDGAVVRVHPAPGQPAHTGAIVPAAQGNLFLDVEPGPAIPNALIAPQRANVFIQGQFKPIAGIEGLNKPVEGTPRLLHLTPQYGVFVMLSAASNELLLHPFDLDAALAKSATDYLVVLSEAPGVPVAGKPFEFTLVVKSKRGGVKLTLTDAPAGMTAADGKLTWAVPPDAAGREVSVLLTVTDASGQSVRQTFRLKIAAAGAGVVLPALPLAPPPRELLPAVPKVPAPGLPVAPPPRDR